MQNIKETIGYICEILQTFNINYIVPEDLRKAKFD